jgi:5-formyltetrahydrofolate cyclo-ligase
MKAHLRHIESSTTEELRRVKATLENQLQNRAADPRKREERPALRALPSRQPGHNEVGTRHAKDACEVPLQATAAEKIDARTFVFACLSKNPDLKLAEIEQLAFAAGKELSQPTASRYRKQFFARCENSSVVESESSTMKGPGVDESALSSERKVIGE